MRQWYVVGMEPKEGDFYVYVFGPFITETDARAYAIDLGTEEEGFLHLDAKQLTHEEAGSLATEQVLWPYNSEPFHKEGD